MELKNKLFRQLSLLLVVTLMAVMVIIPVSASSGMGFYITPTIPENQTDPGLGYFNLRVEPEMKQTLEVVVENNTTEEKTFVVSITNASTTPRGEISYVVPDVKDETLQHPLDSLARLEQTEYQLKGNQSLSIPIHLTMPKDPFDGCILGGIKVTDVTARRQMEADKTQIDSSGQESTAQIINEYEMVLAVLLSETDKEIPANFELVDVSAETINYRAGIVAKIRNTEANLFKEAVFSGEITQKSTGTPLFTVKNQEVGFAPNSVMAYEFTDEAGYGIDAGEYHFTGSIEQGGKTWDFEHDFTIAAEQAATVNDSALNQNVQHQRGNDGLPTWLIIVIIIAVLVILVLIIVIVKMKKSGKNS